MKRAFSAGDISLVVFGVLSDTRFDGRHAGYALSSPLERPQGFPVFISTHFSSNHLPRPPRPLLGFFGFAGFRGFFRSATGCLPISATTLLIFAHKPRICIRAWINRELALGLSLYASIKRLVYWDVFTRHSCTASSCCPSSCPFSSWADGLFACRKFPDP